MIAVSYGGGTNSTAMLVGLFERGIVPDAITFADTGGEKPETYEHVEIMKRWCIDNGFPPIVTVRKVTRDGNVLSLEDNCLQQKMLPSIAYGFKSCSLKYKVAPQDKHFNNLPEAKEVWAQGDKVIKYIGYDADEERRAHIVEDEKYSYRYPLIEWGWGRKECIEAIERAGIPLPGKSACYFCPSSKVTEIKWLAAKHPDLMDRAIAMERNAQLTQVKGLGRSFRWEDVIATDDMFGDDSYIDLACGCYDG
jgi:hypothetical protein